MYNEDRYYEVARKKVKEKRKFYKHLTSYVSVISILFLINMFTNPWHWWFKYPAFFWGISIFMHYVKVFGLSNSKYHQDGWEEEEIEKEVNRMKARDGYAHSYPHEDIIDEVPEEELELKEFKKLRKEWDDADFV